VVAEVPSHQDDDTICRLFSSSGTTGTPKQIAVTHALMMRRIEAKNRISPLPPNPVQIQAVWPTGGYGFRDALRVLHAGGKVLFCVRVDDILASISAHAVNFLVVPPALLRHLAAARPPDAVPFPSLAAIEVGGSNLPRQVWEAARTKLCPVVLSSYGATETGSVAAARMDDIVDRPGAVGRIIEGVDVQAVDGNRQPLPMGSEGVLRIRSDLCVHRYFRDPGATASAFEDGWFYPGDVGSVSADRVLSVSGRVGEMINLGGAKISPAVIEDLLLSLPGVRDAGAFGVPDADGIVEVWAAIVPAGPVAMPALFEACHERLLGRAPKYIIDVAEIPRNDGGKIRRDALVAIAQQRLAAKRGSLVAGNAPPNRVH
jgi:acyl-coenzyme A synthetase/AMP-(fatty) acid ligase